MTLQLRPSTTMDQRGTYQERTTTKDANRVPIEAYADIKTVWCHVKAMGEVGQSERVEMMREEHPVTHKIRVDADSDFKPGGRMVVDSNAYDISGIDDTGVQWNLRVSRGTR